jgi:putative FmdB family regulatory protein
MPVFEYICDSCGHRTESMTRGDIHHCQNCGLQARRRFSFQIAASFQSHYNVAVGKYVTNRTEFEDGLKVASEEQTVKLGMEVNYAPIDMQDREACGVSEEGAAAAIEARVKAGAA